MKISDYQKEAYTAIQKHEDEKDEILNWAVGLAEETGEVMNLIKHNFWAGEEMKPEELAKEIGDVLWYTSALCSAYKIDLEVVAKLNLGKLQHRHTQGKFSERNSSMRHELEQKFSESDVYKEIVKNLVIKE